MSEPVNPIQSELPPAIPAMLSKAKGLLKKKLKPSSGDLSPLPSPSPPAEEQTVDKAEEESQMIKCPQEVEELIECSAKTRCVHICEFDLICERLMSNYPKLVFAAPSLVHPYSKCCT